MHRRTLLCFAAASALLALPVSSLARTDAYRLSGPFVHENLAIYLVHGRSAAGPVPLTLQEAMAKGLVRVNETGRVNQLTIENLGDEEVYVQSGDIVKGGKQDRVLVVSMVLPPRSGRMAIDSFCVEQGRWSARGREDARTFSSSAATMPSRRAKLAMKAPTPSRADADRRPAPSSVSERQHMVWQSVAMTQNYLAGSLGRPVASPQSRTSLQLALENERLQQAIGAYLTALQGSGERDSDVIGYVFAINGKINSADIYPSNALFRKMWAKMIRANAVEAIGEKDAAAAEPPSVATVTAFLDAAERGSSSERELTQAVRMETRDSPKAVYFETRRARGGWVHRNYLAK